MNSLSFYILVEELETDVGRNGQRGSTMAVEKFRFTPFPPFMSVSGRKFSFRFDENGPRSF